MSTLAYNPEPFGYYKGSDLPTGAGTGAGAAGEAKPAQVNGVMESRNTEKESANKERERAIEAWMSDIKAFIRNIDVTKL